MNIFVILGLIYLVSLLLFRWFVKIDIRGGFNVPPTLALMLTLIPVVNTIMVIVWCISEIDFSKFAQKFFREKF